MSFNDFITWIVYNNDNVYYFWGFFVITSILLGMIIAWFLNLDAGRKLNTKQQKNEKFLEELENVFSQKRVFIQR